MVFYEKYMREITQMEAEEGVSESLEFIRGFEHLTAEEKSGAMRKWHATKKKLEAIFEERLDLSSSDASTLFREYSGHFMNQKDMQKASNDFFQDVEEKIQNCIENDDSARAAYDGIRDFYARSAQAPFKFQGDIGLEDASVSQLVNFQKQLSKKIAENYRIDLPKAQDMVDKFCKLQNLNAKQLVQIQLNQGME